MLRRHFVFPLRSAAGVVSTQNFLVVCPAVTTSCAGILSASSLVLARPIRPHGIIGFRNRKRNAHCVESVRKWKWPFCQQFTDLVHKPTLSLPTTRKMAPSMQVFSELDIDDKILRNQPRDKETGAYIPVYKHCNIEEVMKANGFMPELDDGQYVAASPKKRMLMLAEYDKRRGVSNILEANRRMVGQMSTSRRHEQNKILRNERQIDVGALMFLQLCGFNDGLNFELTSRGQDFRIFGKTCHSKPGVYMVERVKNKQDLVLIFEGKSVPESSKTLPHSGHLGQIVGEMLMMLSLNRDQKAYRSVFGVSYINSHVCGFRLDPSKLQMKTLVETRNVPNKKLELLCTEEDPAKSRGWSLIDKKERFKALQMMADIRNFILNQ